MKLVIDTNIIISALIREGLTRKMILFPGIELFTPEITLKEILKHKDAIIVKSKLPKDDIDKILEVLNRNIKTIPETRWLKFYRQTTGIIGKKDPKDVPFMAVALALSVDGIWSNDSDFEIQSDIKIWKTPELAQELGFIEEKK